MERNSLNDIRDIDFIMASHYPYLLLKRWYDGEITELYLSRPEQIVSNLHSTLEYLLEYKVYRINPADRSVVEVRVELYEPEKEAV